MDIIDRLRETAEEFESIGHDAEELHEASDEIERLRALLAEVCPPGLQKVSADLDARIRSALAAKGEE